ncbi:MAG: WXG100 family type VII secretion target [Actinomycetota bacterium]|nr:WXG100 family type VII secretion target [Actinomycetota bacterium]
MTGFGVGDGLLVRFEAMRDARADVAATARSLEDRLADLRRFLAPLAGSWTGVAAQRYASAQQQWDAAAGELIAVLNEIGDALDAATEEFVEAERHNVGMWAPER